MEALATKYRPHVFEDVCGQKSVIAILKRQLETKEFKNCYLFAGASGCGKTTLARIFADEINHHCGSPIEIDGASNNGVDNIRNIIQSASLRAIDAEYKVIIIDEAHMLTQSSWNALLKTLEEPPKYTIFIFCTTDPQKIPQTILNRLMRFNLSRLGTDEITRRLKFICREENFANYEEATDYIAKISNGGMRDAIAMLDKCSGYSKDLRIDNVLTSLGDFSYSTMFNLTNALIDGNDKAIVDIVDNVHASGNDLKLFASRYVDFVLDLDKYCLFNDISKTKIPSSLTKDVQFATGIQDNTKYYNWLVDKLLDVRNALKNDSSAQTTLTIMLLNIARGVK